MAATSYNAVLVGNYGVGKTSIFCRLMYDKYTEEGETITTSRNSELEKYIYTTCVGDDAAPVELTLWDTGGQERHDSMTCNYYRWCNAVILVYDTSDLISLTSLHDWGKAAQTYSNLKENIVIFLWGNKADVATDCDSAQKWDTALQALMSEFNIPPSLHFIVSAKTGANVHTAFDSLVRDVHSRRSCARNSLIAPEEEENELITVPENQVNAGSGENSQCSC